MQYKHATMSARQYINPNLVVEVYRKMLSSTTIEISTEQLTEELARPGTHLPERKGSPALVNPRTKKKPHRSRVHWVLQRTAEGKKLLRENKSRTGVVV